MILLRRSIRLSKPLFPSRCAINLKFVIEKNDAQPQAHAVLDLLISLSRSFDNEVPLSPRLSVSFSLFQNVSFSKHLRDNRKSRRTSLAMFDGDPTKATLRTLRAFHQVDNQPPPFSSLRNPGRSRFSITVPAVQRLGYKAAPRCMAHVLRGGGWKLFLILSSHVADDGRGYVGRNAIAWTLKAEELEAFYSHGLYQQHFCPLFEFGMCRLLEADGRDGAVESNTESLLEDKQAAQEKLQVIISGVLVL